MYHEEQALMNRIAEGDQKSFEILFDQLMNPLFRLCYSLLLDHQVAEDATQEVFSKIWDRADSWRPEASIKTWACRIARNHCLDILRKKQNDRKKHYALYKETLIEEPHYPPSAEFKTDLDKHKIIIKNAIFELPERQREAITLVYYLEVHNSEAAHIMDMKAVAFDSLLARARRNLRNRLDSHQNILEECYKNGTK